MNTTKLLADREKLIQRGRLLFQNRTFPNEILENINDERLRNDISKQIFSPNDKPFDSLSSDEQNLRKSVLKVLSAFEDYMQSFQKMKSIAYLLIIISLISTASSVMKLNENLYFGIITGLIGIAILYISFNKKIIVKYSLYIFLIYSLLYILEFIFLRFPSPYFGFVNNDILQSRRGGATKIINILLPYVYVIFRIVVAYFLFEIHKVQKVFAMAKNTFEKKK